MTNEPKSPPPETETAAFDRFEQLARKIANVPKDKARDGQKGNPQ